MQAWSSAREVELTPLQKVEHARARLQGAVASARSVLGYNAEIIHAIDEAIEVLGFVIARNKKLK